MSVDTHEPITEPQERFLGILLKERDFGTHRQRFEEQVKAGGITKREASQMITWAKTLPYLPKNQDELPVEDAPQREVVELTEGMYLMDKTIFKVQRAVHGSGLLYAKQLTTTTTCPGHLDASDPSAFDAPYVYCEDPTTCPSKTTKVTFDYMPGVIRKLRPEHRMSLEQAKEYGALYGTCIRCGRTLTDEDSIENQIGPVCARYFTN